MLSKISIPLHAISNCTSDRYGFIDYRSAYKYERALGKYIEEAADLVEKNDYDTAFVIITIILDSIPKTGIDDSNGSTGTIAEYIFLSYSFLDI